MIDRVVVAVKSIQDITRKTFHLPGTADNLPLPIRTSHLQGGGTRWKEKHRIPCDFCLLIHLWNRSKHGPFSQDTLHQSLSDISNGSDNHEIFARSCSIILKTGPSQLAYVADQSCTLLKAAPRRSPKINPDLGHVRLLIKQGLYVEGSQLELFFRMASAEPSSTCCFRNRRGILNAVIKHLKFLEKAYLLTQDLGPVFRT